MDIATPDGRLLQVVDTGGTGLPCLFHGGTPMGPVLDEAAADAAASAGLRWITYGRPGYGDSTSLLGRDVAQAAADSATVLDHLDLQTFVTYGLSGGGPHALACAALLPDRCLGVATVGGVGPDNVADLDFVDGMAQENVEEFAAAHSGRAALEAFLGAAAPGLRDVTGSDIVAALGGLVGPVDQAALTGPVGDYFAAAAREALRNGSDGWRDDDLAFVRPWGFDLHDIEVPVAIWQGGQDLMVPPAHGRWLAAHIAIAREHFEQEQGHLSLGVAHLPQILRDLAEHARR